MAGNQLGKTHSGAAETAMHLTGRYPEWWNGVRFNHPIRAWVAGVTNETTRDIVQRKLLGAGKDWGSGFIPKDTLVGDPITGRGLPNAVDFFQVQHASGGQSWCSFKAYEQGREKFQAESLDWIWLDEEPPDDIFTECEARTTATQGHLIITFTPLKGISDVVRKFWPSPDSPMRGFVQMTIEDAPHIPEEEVKAIISRYPPHEREARARGIPALGSGRVFTAEESLITEAPVELRDFWFYIVGLDLGGGDHPTAAVWLAHDRDTDVIHLYDCYKSREPQIAIHAAAITQRGRWIPVSWPHDAWTHDRSSGLHFAGIYEKHGCTMLPEHAQFPEGGFGIEAGVAEMEDRLKTGRLRVASHLSQWFDEYRQYHRDKGQIVKKFDDLMAATRYGIMMLRYARRQARIKLPPTVGTAYDPLARRH